MTSLFIPLFIMNHSPESLHTPGPWIVYEDDRPIIMACVGDENYDVCELSTDRPITEIAANARLIAASPKLFATCEEMIAFSFEEVRTREGYPEAVRQWCGIKRKARAALAEAQGQAA